MKINISNIEKELLIIKNILNDIRYIKNFHIDIKLDLKDIQKVVRKKRNNIELDTKVLKAIELLKTTDKKVSYRNIAKLLNKEKSLRSIQLSIIRQDIKL